MTGAGSAKCVIVISDTLSIGHAVNAASVLSVTLGYRVGGLVGGDVEDADGVVHPGIIATPLPVLQAEPAQLAAIATAAKGDEKIFSVSFSTLAQRCRSYEEYIRAISIQRTDALDSIAVALHGPRKRVDRLVGALPLLR